MIGFLLFWLTFLTYILIAIFAQTTSSGGDQFGRAYSAFVLISAYAVFSLLLTIKIAANGGFNWISDSTLKRNFIVALIWLGMMSIAMCTLGKTEYHKYYHITGFARSFSFFISYGAIWLPLLILIPYFIFLKPEWRETWSPILFKVSLAIGCLLGFLWILTPKIMSDLISKSYKKLDERELAFNSAMRNIEKYQDVMSLLYYISKTYDEQIRNAALAKIKANKNMEDELIGTLERSSPYRVFDFLDENKVEHPERFIEPIVKSFSVMIADMEEGIKNPYDNGAFDVGPLLRVLEEQFNGSIEVFKPNVLKLYEVMKTPPAKNRVYVDTEQSNEVLYAYREEVKNWLARHK